MMRFQVALGLFLVVFALGISACQAQPVERLNPRYVVEEPDLDTGIQGQAQIQTRLSAEDIFGPSPFIGVIHILDSDGNIVGLFSPDENGSFKVPLPSGEYHLVADQPLIRHIEHSVIVPAQGYLEIDLLFEIPLT